MQNEVNILLNLHKCHKFFKLNFANTFIELIFKGLYKPTQKIIRLCDMVMDLKNFNSMSKQIQL